MKYKLSQIYHIKESNFNVTKSHSTQLATHPTFIASSPRHSHPSHKFSMLVIRLDEVSENNFRKILQFFFLKRLERRRFFVSVRQDASLGNFRKSFFTATRKRKSCSSFILDPLWWFYILFRVHWLEISSKVIISRIFLN